MATQLASDGGGVLASSAMHAPLLLDTDIGTDVDDDIALALILASPEIDLRAVTTVSGDVQLRGQIAAKLLALAGLADVPIAAGVREPLLRQRNFLWLGHEGHGIVSAGERLPLRAMHAVDVLIEMVMRERPEVIAIGPLTNLAVAIIKEPAVIDAIPHLTVMGGILGRSAGLPLLEYNLASDAEALETTPSKSGAARGALKQLGEVFNQNGELVMTLRAISIIGRRPA